MGRGSLAVVAVGLFVTAGAADSDAVKQELKKFEGTWAVVSTAKGGKKAELGKSDSLRIILKGTTYKLQFNGKVVDEGTFKVDPTKTPKWLDITPAKGQGKTIRGVYELKDDTYTVCTAGYDEERPTALKSEPGNNNFLQTAKRVKE